jgi:hypothetical protein
VTFLETPDDHIAFWDESIDDVLDYVYVMQGDPGTPIKIGHAVNPIARLATFQTGNPQELRLLWVTPGGEPLERAFHRRLKGSRIRGEWFGAPGADRFLEWMPEYVDSVVTHFEEHGELPPLPSRKQDAYSPSERSGANILHRWRMSQPHESELTVRFVEPNPITPEERQEREERAFMGFTRTSDDSNPVSSPEGAPAGSVPG